MNIKIEKQVSSKSAAWEKINPVALSNPKTLIQLKKILLATPLPSYNLQQWIQVKKKIVKIYSKQSSRAHCASNAILRKAKAHLSHLLINKPKIISDCWKKDFVATTKTIQKHSLHEQQT